MANNCLVTKLKSVVNNDNLIGLGVLRINRVYNESDTENDSYIGISRSIIPNGKTVKLTIVGDGYFMDSFGGANIGKTVEVTHSDEVTVYSLWTSNGNYIIDIENKYDCYITILQKDYQCNISDLYYTKTSTIQGAGLYGDLGYINNNIVTIISLNDGNVGKVTYTDNDIEKLTNLTNLRAVNGLPMISMSALGKLTNLEGTMEISCAKGRIEDFVINQRLNGRVTFSGTLNFTWVGATNQVTYKGNTIENVANGEITWTADTMTFRGETINV